FWSALRIEMIHLRDISVDFVNHSVLEYLESYSGVRSMLLIIWGQEVNSGSPRFWHNILPKHADTLVDLDVRSEYAGGWCLDNRSLAAIRQCTRLEILRVTVDQETLGLDDERNIIVGPIARLRV
ncbi:hypothetical protein IW262DRAFT_1267777, partial [Armillaria fumosa]